MPQSLLKCARDVIHAHEWDVPRHKQIEALKKLRAMVAVLDASIAQPEPKGALPSEDSR
jgi:hypothetical protein